MLDAVRFQDFCEEFYCVEKSVEVYVHLRCVDDTRRIRVDALYAPGSAPTYTAAAYIEEVIEVASSRAPYAKGSVWINFGLPSMLTGKSADDAIAQALCWLRNHCSKVPAG
jgi:hypothetical protein